MAISPRIELCLLGRFAARLATVTPRIVQISAPKRRAVLAYLAMQPSLMETRERLAALLWGDGSDKQARQSLRQCLVALRRELAPVEAELLVIERDAVGLRPDLVKVDARELLDLAASVETASTEGAFALYRGEFLDGLDLGPEPFVDWVRGERAKLAAAAARVFESYALRQDKAGYGAQAVVAAERLVALDPLREHAQRLLLRLQARHCGRDAALTYAGTMHGLLRHELGAEPEPETTALIDEIRRGVVAAAGPIAARPLGAATTTAILAELAAPSTERIGTERGLDVLRSAASRWSMRRLAVSGFLIGILATGGFLGVSLISADRGLSRRSNEALATPAADNTGWRSPLIAGVRADQGALSSQGVSALVVLPFVSESPERSQERNREQVLADRMTDDLINDLSHVPALRVISRATSRLYRGHLIDVAAVGAELGVRYVIEGSVQLQGSAMRVNVSLTSPATRLQVWSERFERGQVDRFAMQDEISQSIARQLHVRVLTAEDERRPPDTTSASPGVDELVSSGWAAMLRIGATGTTSGADGYFERALQREPDNVSALTGLGAYNVSVVAMFLVADTDPYLARAEAALDSAIKIKPRASLAHYFRGILYKARGQPHSALDSFRTVLALNPSFAPSYAQTGHVLSRIGRLDRAMDYVRYAIRLSPKDPNLGLWSLFGGQIELERGHDAEAMEWLSRAAALDARGPFMHASLAAAFALRGDKAEAAREAGEVRRLVPWITPERMVGRLVGLSDTGSEPKRLLQGLRMAFAAQF